MAATVKGHVKSVSGEAYLVTSGGRTIPITTDTLIPEGSRIRTGSSPDSSVVVEWVPGDTSIVMSGTSVTVSSLHYSRSGDEGPAREVSLHLSEGDIFSHLEHQDGGTTDFKVKTAEGVAAARGTDLNCSISNGIFRCVCFSDKVTITLPDGKSFTLSTGEGYHTGGPLGGRPTAAEVRGIINALRALGFTVTGSPSTGITISGYGVTIVIGPYGPPNQPPGGPGGPPPPRPGPPGESPQPGGGPPPGSPPASH